MPKESRVAGVSEEVRGYLDRGSMRGVDANALGQRVRFLRETHFGRCGSKVLTDLMKHSRAAGAVSELSGE